MFIKTTMVAVVMMGLTFFISPAWSTGINTQSQNTHSASQGLSASEHLRLADAAKESFEDLEGQIEEIQARIDKFNKKPYLDTKGFKRQGLRLWKGKLVNELKEAGNEVVWHEMQAREMLASEKKDQKDS